MNRLPVTLEQENSFFKKTIFSINKLNLKFFAFNLERILFRLLLFPLNLKLRNIFEKKKKSFWDKQKFILRKQKILLGLKPKSRFGKKLSPISISRHVFKRASSYYRLTFFLQLKDAINLFNLAFFFNKSELISEFIGELIRDRGKKQFFGDLQNLQLILNAFPRYVFDAYGTGIKIAVFGKMQGQKKRRFRRFILNRGAWFSTQKITLNLSYNLKETGNIFGSFGVKV